MWCYQTWHNREILHKSKYPVEEEGPPQLLLFFLWHQTEIKYGKSAKVVFFLALRILLNTSPLCTRGLQPHTERVRQGSRERSVLVPMVLAVSIDNRQRHRLSKIRLHWMFQWKWAATHQGNVKKTETEPAKKTVYMTTMHTNRLTVPSQ